MFGNSADLQIFHDATDSVLYNATGSLDLRSNSSIELVSADGTETYAKFIKDGAVELYHNNVKKGETTADGWSVTGLLTASGNIQINNDTSQIRLGASQDLRIYHNGSASYIEDVGPGNLFIRAADNLSIQSYNGSENMARFIENGAVELYHNNVKTFQTDPYGSVIYGPEGYGAHLYMYADEGDDNADKWALLANAAGTFSIRNYSTGSWVDNLTLESAGQVGIGLDNPSAFSSSANNLVVSDTSSNGGITIVNGTSGIGSIFFADGTSTNSRGRLRYQHSNDSLILATAETTALTLDSSQNATFAGTVSDSIGELRQIPSRSVSSVTLATSDVGKAILATSTVTVPNSTFSAGDAVTIINNSGGDITITKSISTMYLASDGSSANRTLATRGMATIWFASGTVAYISGAGLS